MQHCHEECHHLSDKLIPDPTFHEGMLSLMLRILLVSYQRILESQRYEKEPNLFILRNCGQWVRWYSWR